MRKLTLLLVLFFSAFYLSAADTVFYYSTVKYELKAYGNKGATETVALVMPGEKLTFQYIEAMTVTDKKDWIAAVKTDSGVKGYIPMHLLTTQVPVMKAQSTQRKSVFIPQKKFVTAVAFNLKDGPSVKGKTVGQVVKDDKVSALKYGETTEYIKGYVAKWVQVRTETGLTGWVFGSILADKLDLGNGSIWDEKDFDPKVASTIPKGIKKLDYGEVQAFSKAYEGFRAKGPMWKSFKGGKTPVYSVEVPKVLVYSFPGNAPVAAVKKGFQGAIDSVQNFNITGRPESWGYLRSSAADGWVEMKYFKKTEALQTVDPGLVKKGITDVPSAELQSKPYIVKTSTLLYNFPNSDILLDLKKGDKVKVSNVDSFGTDGSAKMDKWAYLKFNEVEGWAIFDALSELEDPAPAAVEVVNEPVPTAVVPSQDLKGRIIKFYGEKMAFYKTRPAKEGLGDKAKFTSALNALAVKYKFRDNTEAAIKAKQMVNDQEIRDVLTQNVAASQVLQISYQLIGAYKEKIELFKSERARDLWYKEAEFIQVLDEIALKWGFSSNNEQRYLYENEFAFDEDIEYFKTANNDAYQALSDYVDQNPRDAVTSTGAMTYPTKGAFMISSNFGPRYIGGKWDNHTGIDFIGRGGSINGRDAVAIDNSRVIFAGVSGGYGNLVILQHANTVTYYAHLSRISVKDGQELKKGDPIGAVGSTGWSTGPHLHFEFRDKLWGKVFDPRTFFTDLPKEMQ